jgi:YHS domain-containing protein
MRLLLLAGLIYLLYRAAKSWISAGSRASSELADRTAGEIDDVMVKDPFCEAYFPKRNGVKLRIKGQELLFCSPECRDKFIERHKSSENGG